MNLDCPLHDPNYALAESYVEKQKNNKAKKKNKLKVNLNQKNHVLILYRKQMMTI